MAPLEVERGMSNEAFALRQQPQPQIEQYALSENDAGTTGTVQDHKGKKRPQRPQDIKLSERKQKKKFKSAYLIDNEEDDIEVIPPRYPSLQGKGKADSLAPLETFTFKVCHSFHEVLNIAHLLSSSLSYGDVCKINLSKFPRNVKKPKNDKHERDACVEANPPCDVKALPSICRIQGKAAGIRKVALHEGSDVKVLITKLQKSVRDIEKTQDALEEKRKKLLSRISDLQTQIKT